MTLDIALEMDDPVMLEAAISEWTDIDRIIKTSDESDVTLLMLAALHDKPRILKYLLGRGASLNSKLQNISVLSLMTAKKSTALRRAALEGGATPDAMFYAVWCEIGEPELADLDNCCAMVSYDAARTLGLEKIANPKQAAKLIVKLPSFKDAYEELYIRARLLNNVDRITQSASGIKNSNKEKSADVRQLDKQIELLATAHGFAVSSALSFYASEPDAVPTVVRRQFALIGNSRKALQGAYKKSVEEIADLFANKFGGYSDDDLPQMAAEFLLNSFPVRSFIKGQIDRAERPIRDLTGRQFEKACAAALEAAGYLVQVTSVTGDQGADLLATKDGLKYAIQCKDVSGSVGNAAVQEIAAGRSYYGADYGAVCTTGKFTDSAHRLAAKNKIILCNHDLLPLIDKLASMSG